MDIDWGHEPEVASLCPPLHVTVFPAYNERYKHFMETATYDIYIEFNYAISCWKWWFYRLSNMITKITCRNLIIST